jgi:hypothetical protein
MGVYADMADGIDVERCIKAPGSGAQEPRDAGDVAGLVAQMENVTHGNSTSI